MSRNTKKTNKTAAAGHVIPLRVPAEMNDRIVTLSSRSGLSRADVMRQSITRGIGELERLLTKPTKVAA